MSEFNQMMNQKAVALRYDEDKNIAPVIVASGAGLLANRIIEVANENNIPVYEDNSLASVLSKLDLGTNIPPELYSAIVDIYVFFLNYSPNGVKEDATQKSISAPAIRNNNSNNITQNLKEEEIRPLETLKEDIINNTDEEERLWGDDNIREYSNSYDYGSVIEKPRRDLKDNKNSENNSQSDVDKSILEDIHSNISELATPWTPKQF